MIAGKVAWVIRLNMIVRKIMAVMMVRCDYDTNLDSEVG